MMKSLKPLMNPSKISLIELQLGVNLVTIETPDSNSFLDIRTKDPNINQPQIVCINKIKRRGVFQEKHFFFSYVLSEDTTHFNHVFPSAVVWVFHPNLLVPCPVTDFDCNSCKLHLVCVTHKYLFGTFIKYRIMSSIFVGNEDGKETYELSIKLHHHITDPAILLKTDLTDTFLFEPVFISHDELVSKLSITVFRRIFEKAKNVTNIFRI